MESSRIVGTNWGKIRLLPDDEASAKEDKTALMISEVGADGVIKGSFKNSTDVLVDGRFIQDGGLRPRIEFTRRNAAGNVTTRFTGSVILVADETTVMIRGRFSRATSNGNGLVAMSSGDVETEKPT